MLRLVYFLCMISSPLCEKLLNLKITNNLYGKYLIFPFSRRPPYVKKRLKKKTSKISNLYGNSCYLKGDPCFLKTH